MQPQVIVKTAQLLELFRTKFAGQDFVHSLGDAVTGVCDRVVFELAQLEPVRPLMLLVVVAVEAAHDFHFTTEVVDVVLNVLGALRIKVDILLE